VSEHLPGDGWDCRTCDMPWPCAPARDRLAADAGDEKQLSIQMWTYFDHYVDAIPAGPVTEAYARFVGWIRARDTPGTVR
jgi:hypothetical protein